MKTTMSLMTATFMSLAMLSGCQNMSAADQRIGAAAVGGAVGGAVGNHVGGGEGVG